jgi:hypothetical protein
MKFPPDQHGIIKLLADGNKPAIKSYLSIILACFGKKKKDKLRTALKGMQRCHPY